MKALGAILAGGSARRFGSDKALALHDGKRLVDWVSDALEAQCASVVMCGREEAGFACLPDQPQAGLGPLGGLNAALVFAANHGFTHALSAGVDAPNLPRDLLRQLGGPEGGQSAAIVGSQPVVGLWPVDTGQALTDYIAQGGRALYGFAERVKARRVTLAAPLMNVNRPEDLRERK